jgi:hypothetical protein
MDQNQGIKTWQWVVTVIVIIILIVLGYYLFKGNNSSVTPGTDMSTTTDMTSDANEVNRIVVSDQYPGNVVYVSSVQLANAGWVEIHKDNNGTPGAIIGSAYFEKGINPGKITLTENTVDGGTYYAMIHTDDGDKKFDPAKDLPLKDSKGNIVMKLFHATTNVTEVKG